MGNLIKMAVAEEIQTPAEKKPLKEVKLYKKSIGVTEILDTEFSYYDLGQPWKDHLGEISQTFKMLVFGHPKNGKTSYLMQLTKYLASFTTVYYNSVEEGKTKTMQDAMRRANLQEVAGRWMLGNRDTYPEMIEKLKRKGSQHVVVIDSRDYMELTTKQYKRLEKMFPNKAIILVCWEQAGKPMGKYAKDIAFMMDIIVHVENFKATPRSRYGGYKPFIVWNRKPEAGEQLNLIS